MLVKSEATYVRAAAPKTFFAPFVSSSVKISVLESTWTARLLALYSTGKVTRSKSTARPNIITPLHKQMSPTSEPGIAAKLKIKPSITSGHKRVELMFVIGIIADLILTGK